MDLEHTSHTLHTPGAGAGVPPLQEVSPRPTTNNYIIEQFPGDQAGTLLKHITPCQSNFEKYQQQLNNNTEYAPFTSQVDWEIAQWAKLDPWTII